MTGTVTFVCGPEAAGERVDRFLVDRLPDLSRSQIQRLIRSGAVTVNDASVRPAYRLAPGDQIFVELPTELTPSIRPEAIPLDIVYEDDYLLVVNKPAGMVVHPAAGVFQGTLVNALLAHCPQVADVGGVERAGIVHRLDKETSGLIVVAKDPQTHAALQRLFKRRLVRKTYVALVDGQVQPREGIIEVPIGRDPKVRLRMTVSRTGRPAVTQYRVVEVFPQHTLLEVRPHTGRTHQIRVHLAWLGYPVVGDRVYGRRRPSIPLDRHFLHARDLAFVHPVTGQKLALTAPLPPELIAVLNELRRGSK
ncbi:MAG: RluA family pseudouridine synthase [Anaerolineae bacterium]|nr:RluA family pseudouridine synthase [Anaerolineae bacterium]MCX8066463.1 RluA family pseudouridine synthase [Anaerolineae bacterium]